MPGRACPQGSGSCRGGAPTAARMPSYPDAGLVRARVLPGNAKSRDRGIAELPGASTSFMIAFPRSPVPPFLSVHSLEAPSTLLHLHFVCRVLLAYLQSF